ncbi:PAS domain S-box-containing protein [Roseateles sp. YR242]|uniref:hybrid sensor histidine kinase/response regulator n=1 Tax=Roseateles sp. YR242 TaxID=1855305 RepID=UPI0008BB993B|nr:ATP-binding protein [Roseateles sp. YR242]SEL19339.1 PAS domain S-box-containing protein [Roseateles sp. YR242]
MRSMLLSDTSRQFLLRLAFVVGLALLAMVLQWLARPLIGSGEPFLFFLPAVALAAVWFGPAPGAVVLLAGLASAGMDEASFQAFWQQSNDGRVTIAAYLIYGVLVLALGERLRQRGLRAAQAQARLRLLAEETDVGLFEYDKLAGTLYLSPPLARLCGVSVPDQAVPALSLLARFPAPLVAQARLAQEHLLHRQGERFEHELAWPTQEGLTWLLLRVRLIRDDQQVTHVRGAVVDITERKRMETQLQETQAKLSLRVNDLHRLQELSTRLLEPRPLNQQFQLVLEAVVALHHAGHGVLSFVDPTDQRLKIEASVGYDAAALQQLQRLMDAGGGTCGMARQQRERVVVGDFQTDPRCEDLRSLARAMGLGASHSTPLITERGELMGMISVQFPDTHEITLRETDLTDLCARKVIVHAERARARADLQAADRRKDEFLATLAHELRNPLAPIRQAALLSSAPQATEAQKRWSHGVIERQVQHMALLLDDLLDISRITRGALSLRLEEVELNAVIESAVETARPTIEGRQHQLQVELPKRALHFEGDALRLAQVVANLLTNAAKYTEPGGKLLIRANAQGAEVLIEVCDNGIGIPRESLGEVFNMFTQLRRAGGRLNEGLGIGLALTRGLVELHGGRIDAYSEGAGCGSRFVVRLPLRHAVPAAPAAGRPWANASGPLSILVADDNRDAAESLGHLLRLQGHKVVLAFDGQEALDAFEHEPVDACLLDIGMPRVDGNEVARRLRTRNDRRPPVLVAITGWGQMTDREDAIAAGFDHHLTKPVDPDKLMQLLARHHMDHDEALAHG